ncbi:MAG TPA: hypothetical protein VGF76_07820 [Polyangiaceae bacterium]|jgi:hypothetical protein
MNSPTSRNALILSAASLLCSLALGCDKHEAQRDTDADAAPPKPKAATDDEPDLAQAVAAVGARSGAGANNGVAAGAAAGGPPPNGIFGPGEADKALAKGAPTTLTLGGDGSEPRVQLGPAPKPGSKRSGTLTIASQSDPQQGAIPISFALSLETQRAKTDGDAGAAAPLQVAAKVIGATINAPGVPPDLAGAIGKLKGSRIDYEVSADGAGSNFHYAAPKGIDPAFRDALQGLSDTLALLALPFPTKPVGLGGFWMVTSRDVVMGLDVVTYRLVKVEKVEGSSVELSLNTKRYAASSAFNVEGLPPDAPHVMGEFRAGGEGKLTMSAGQAFPNSGDLQSLLGAALGPAPEPSQAPGAAKPQRPMVQVQSRVTIAFSGP